MVHIGNDWDKVLEGEFEKPYYLKLRQFLIEEYKNYRIYPNMYQIFTALEYCAYRDVKVVILGQDPYHGPGQANGLCFSVDKGVPYPPSLQNILNELWSELDIPRPLNGDLHCWAEQGVLLLNTVLTVREHCPGSHRNRGWEQLTDRIIRELNHRDSTIVYMLWGADARSHKALITNPKHVILETVHPSPLSAYRGFIGCGHFKKANQILQERGIEPIDWSIPN